MKLKFEGSEGRSVLVNIRPNAVTIALGDVDVLTFDRAGRLVTAVLDGHTYRRGLDGRVLEKWREQAGGLIVPCRRRLTEPETRSLIDRIQLEIRSAAAALDCVSPRRDDVLAMAAELRRLSRVGAEALARDVARLSRIYRPVTILPPDQYLALVLQVTEGCSYNRCAFCGFYRDRPFRVKAPAEIEAHIAAVAGFLGAGITLRRSVFLADANALCLPLEQLLPLLELVNTHLEPLLGGGSSRGIYSFVDMFSDRQRTAGDYAELRSRNVRRLDLGVETGSRELLKFLRKPQEPEDIAETVRSIKRGGLEVGAILMLGVGGREFGERHVDESVQLLNSLPWSRGDVVFLSEFVEFPGLEYPELARKSGIHPLSPGETAEQYRAIASGVRREGTWPKIAPYNAEDSIY